MATNTKNYNFKKPDESDFYDIQDQNGNWDIADEKMEELSAPTFEDYSGTTSVPEASTAIEAIKSKKKIPEILANIKAAFKGVCLLGHIVNNCVTDNAKLPLSAAQGKALMDQITKLNGDKLAKSGLFMVILNFSYAVPANGSADITVPCDRDGCTVLGVAGLSGLVTNCIARQYHTNMGKVYISIYNKASSQQSGTGTVRVLYKAE